VPGLFVGIGPGRLFLLILAQRAFAADAILRRVTALTLDLGLTALRDRAETLATFSNCFWSEAIFSLMAMARRSCSTDNSAIVGMSNNEN